MKFLHKGHKRQEIAADPKWTKPKFKGGKSTFKADKNGVLEAVLYGPTEYETDEPSTLRVRLVRHRKGRKPKDPTGYDERTLLPGGDGYARVRFHYVGVAEKGRKYHWEIQIVGPAKAALTGTHYAQFWRR